MIRVLIGLITNINDHDLLLFRLPEMAYCPRLYCVTLHGFRKRSELFGLHGHV